MLLLLPVNFSSQIWLVNLIEQTASFHCFYHSHQHEHVLLLYVEVRGMRCYIASVFLLMNEWLGCVIFLRSDHLCFLSTRQLDEGHCNSVVASIYISTIKIFNEWESWDGGTTGQKVGHGSCWKDSKIALLQFNSICISQWCEKERTIMNDQTNQATKLFSLGGLSEDSAAPKHAPPKLLCSSIRNKSSPSFDELHLPFTHIFHIHTYFCLLPAFCRFTQNTVLITEN